MAPHGFAPSEVWGWSFGDYRQVVAALNKANGGEEAATGEAPTIEEHRAKVAAYLASEAHKNSNQAAQPDAPGA